MRLDHHEKSKHEPITDAFAVQAHIGHGKEVADVTMVHDSKNPGLYHGRVRFEHAGKETIRVAVISDIGSRERAADRSRRPRRVRTSPR